MMIVIPFKPLLNAVASTMNTQQSVVGFDPMITLASPAFYD